MSVKVHPGHLEVEPVELEAAGLIKLSATSRLAQPMRQNDVCAVS